MSINSAMLAGASGMRANASTLAAISDNIANVNTVGFKRYEVRFEDLLKERLAEGGSPAEVEPVVVRDESGEPGQNNVTLVEETALLDKTKLMHDFATRRMGSYFGTLNKAIFGR